MNTTTTRNGTTYTRSSVRTRSTRTRPDAYVVARMTEMFALADNTYPGYWIRKNSSAVNAAEMADA
jgi:hypothetical protein